MFTPSFITTSAPFLYAGHDRAMAHVFEMEEKGVCREPMAKFIQVRHHELASPESNYVPECTVVYRCHKDYGCCNSTSECGVKTSAYIYRTFWVITCFDLALSLCGSSLRWLNTGRFSSQILKRNNGQ